MTTTTGASEAPPQPLTLDWLRTMRKHYSRGTDLEAMLPVGGPSIAYAYTGIALVNETTRQLGQGSPLGVLVTRSLYEAASRELGEVVTRPDWWLLEAMHAAAEMGCQVRDLTLAVHGVRFTPLTQPGDVDEWLSIMAPALVPGPEHSAPLACMFCNTEGEDSQAGTDMGNLVRMRITDLPGSQRLLSSRIPRQLDLPVCDSCWGLVQEGEQYPYPLRVTGPTSGQWIGGPFPGDPQARRS